MKAKAALISCLLALPAQAADLILPTANVVRVDESNAASVRLPDSPWIVGTTTPATEGAIRRSVLRLPDVALTTLQLIEPLRSTLIDDGFTQVFACADAECGGFDFRFQLDLLGEPDMHVDLGDYRYLLMRKPGASPHTVSLVASSSGSTGFVHITEVSDAAFPQISVDPTPPQATGAATVTSGSNDLVEEIVGQGSAVLADLDFATGSSDLTSADPVSLTTLTNWLVANPSARIVLVGHTDAVGSLEANTTLSRRRATTVADRLVALGADPTQIQAAGAGYLSPAQSNLTPEGRAANRRVEVVLLTLDP